MGKAFLLCTVLVCLSCSKEERNFDVRLRVDCIRCAVQFTANGVIQHDTVHEVINYHTAPYDTVAGTGIYNLSLKKGALVSFEACRLRPDTNDGSIDLEINGDVPITSTNAAYPIPCAGMELTVN